MLLLSTVFHYRKNFKRYLDLPKSDFCTFCEDDLEGRSVAQTEHFYIVPNRVMYDLWEVREVIDHLLVIPRAHTESLGHLNDTAKLELLNICAEYEQRGHHSYARGVGAQSRTVRHQHTHLIKTKQNKVRAQISISKPHYIFKI